jgi:pyruvate formate lyase activating enzyme
MGRFKWERLGLEYSLADVEPPGAEAVERVSDIFRSAGLEAY